MPAPIPSMRVIFTGTGDIGLPLLKALLADPALTIAAVICQPDKPVGRKQILTPPATKTAALAAGIPVLQPQRIRQIPGQIAALEPDLMIVMAYGQILPEAILTIPRLGCINLHASLLPRHRGASPIQSAILAGDAESGITVMQMDAGLDTGDILHTMAIPLSATETGGSLHDRLAELTPAALQAILPAIAAGTVVPQPQDDRLATHCGKLTRSDGEIDWNRPAAELERRIRAFDPWPGTTTALPDGSRAKIFPPAGHDSEATGCPLPGTILHAGPDGIRVACGSGSLTIHEIQAEGRRRLPAGAFLSGHPLRTGDRMNTTPSSPSSSDSSTDSPAPVPNPPVPEKGTPVHDTADKGCLLMLFLLLIGVFLFPAILLLGGSPVIVPLMTAFLLALATPFLNPAERMNDRAKWTGRFLTWLGLVLLFAGAAVAAYFFLFPRKPI